MKLNLFRDESGRRMVNWPGILIFYLIVPFVVFAGWVAVACVLTGDWAWKWQLGVTFSFMGPTITLGYQLVIAWKYPRISGHSD